MSTEVIVVTIGGFFGLASIVIPLLLGRRKDKLAIKAMQRQMEADDKAADDAGIAARLGDVTKLRAEIDKMVAEATKELREELDVLKRQFAESERKHDAIVQEVQVYITRLFTWNFNHRAGPMPLPPEGLLDTLQLRHLLDLMSRTDTMPTITPKE